MYRRGGATDPSTPSSRQSGSPSLAGRVGLPIHIENTFSKREKGVYYTAGNPFENPAFKDWAKKAKLTKNCILEPFAGANSLIENLSDMGWCRQSKSFDIAPSAKGVRYKDTLADFPQGYEICITNPPWLAKNSATVRGIPFPETRHDDLYKVALEQCLDNCAWVGALVPESFIRSGLFTERLVHFVSLTGKMFADTGHPVGLALFQPQSTKDVMVWRNECEIGKLSELEKARPRSNGYKVKVTFNASDGNVGLIALDNTIEQSIRFCNVSELADYNVKPTGRHITKIKVSGNIKIQAWNKCLKEFRDSTQDVLLTCYKGIRKDGWYRRRLDWETARGIINHVA